MDSLDALVTTAMPTTAGIGWIFADLRAIFEHRRREVERAFARSGHQP